MDWSSRPLCRRRSIEASATPTPGRRTRAGRHAALADRHRLPVIGAVALADRTPRELGELAATTTKLPAHHLLPDAAADSNAPAEEADPHHAVVSRNRTPRGP
jgi:hypothetical protein